MEQVVLVAAAELNRDIGGSRGWTVSGSQRVKQRHWRIQGGEGLVPGSPRVKQRVRYAHVCSGTQTLDQPTRSCLKCIVVVPFCVFHFTDLPPRLDKNTELSANGSFYFTVCSLESRKLRQSLAFEEF